MVRHSRIDRHPCIDRHPRANGDPEDVCYIYWAPAFAGVTVLNGSCGKAVHKCG